MKWTHVCPLFGMALFACATEDQQQLPGPGSSTGANDSGGSAAIAGSTSSDGGSSGKGSSGSSSAGSSTAGSNASGSSSGGTFGFSGSASIAGTFSVGGMPSAGSSAGGSGGKAGAGGSNTGGTGGKASGGATSGGGGTGGSGAGQCQGITLPAKTQWKVTALRSAAADPPERVCDGDNTTRYASGAPQAGDEWLEIDFGEIVTLNQITMFTNNNDYFRHYQLRLSNKTQDFNAPILNEADGMTGSITVPLAQAHAGQYLTIRQTGMVSPTWWSLYEVSIACK